jgi:hypothetical protein
MPIHDWTKVDAGIFHAFHHGWIEELARALNRGVLPSDYYALPEQHAAGFGPDVLTLQGSGWEEADSGESETTSAVLTVPKLTPIAQTDMEFYRRKQKTVTIRHVSGDRVVAMIEIVSPGNKAARNAMRAFVEKAAELLAKGIHLLIIDLFPPGKRDPQVALGDALADMPLFLATQQAVTVALEATYTAAFAEVPRRWRRVLDSGAQSSASGGTDVERTPGVSDEERQEGIRRAPL